MVVQELELLHGQLHLAASLTHWAMLSSTSPTGCAVPGSTLNMLAASVQTYLVNGTQSVVDTEPLQLLLWRLQADKVTSAGPDPWHNDPPPPPAPPFQLNPF